MTFVKLGFLFCLLLTVSLAGCSSLNKQPDKKKKPEPAMKDMGSDVSFQGFVGRLRKAVAVRDMQAIASMMTANFGYRIEPPGEGEGVFQYWDENGVWPELEAILREKFVPKGNFMVAPAQFAAEEQYSGYRAGITNVGGSWKFAYFVNQ